MSSAGNTTARVNVDGSLARRVGSSLVLVPVTVAAAYAGGVIFVALTALAAILMLFEWARIVDGRDFSAVFYSLALGGAAAFAVAAVGAFPMAYAICAATGAAAFAASYWGAKRKLWAALGAAYIIAPTVALIWLRNEYDSGRALTLMLFAIVWSADSGAYFAGRLVGGPKMSPLVSPAKTWAGAAAGLIMGAGAGAAGAIWIYGEGSVGLYILGGSLLGVSSILGDFAESAIKRRFGFKDASQLIPGHGGVLDRLDGMIFATTAMTLALFLHMVFGAAQG